MESNAYADLVSEYPFAHLDLQIGRVIGFESVIEHGEKAHRIFLDFGEKWGVRKSSESLLGLGGEQEFLGKQALCVMDYPSASVARMRSQALFLGFVEDETEFSKADAISFVELVCSQDLALTQTF